MVDGDPQKGARGGHHDALGSAIALEASELGEVAPRPEHGIAESSLFAGARLRRDDEMLGAGLVGDHQALEIIGGSREMDATAILDYFAPLAAWLDEQNAERECGW